MQAIHYVGAKSLLHYMAKSGFLQPFTIDVKAQRRGRKKENLQKANGKKEKKEKKTNASIEKFSKLMCYRVYVFGWWSLIADRVSMFWANSVAQKTTNM